MPGTVYLKADREVFVPAAVPGSVEYAIAVESPGPRTGMYVFTLVHHLRMPRSGDDDLSVAVPVAMDLDRFLPGFGIEMPQFEFIGPVIVHVQVIGLYLFRQAGRHCAVGVDVGVNDLCSEGLKREEKGG